jgi:hypothetical protein
MSGASSYGFRTSPRRLHPIFPTGVGDARTVTQQSTRHRIFAKSIDGGQAVACQSATASAATPISIPIAAPKISTHGIGASSRKIASELRLISQSKR